MEKIVTKVGRAPLYISSFYRAPDSDIEKTQELRSSLDKLCADRNETLPNMVVAGDFNLPSINWSNLSAKPNPQYGKQINEEMINIVKDHSLHQTVTEHTRCENILDLMLTTYPSQLEDVKTIPGMSDHSAVSANINLKPLKAKKLPRKVYVFKKADSTKIAQQLGAFKEDFLNNSPLQRSAKEKWNIIN